MSLKYQKVKYKNKTYAVISIKYKENNLPSVIDWNDLSIVKKLDKRWKSNKYGFISCSHTYNNETREVFLHELIMALKMKDGKMNRQGKPIIHINRIGLDNRRVNLIYDEVDKDHNKNIKKKRRTITLPTDSGINVDEIPTYVWYMKPNQSHGDRFMVHVGDVKWKTTSSKKLSIRYKLEEAKKYLRELMNSRNDLFEDYSMNGDKTREGNALMETYYNIIEKSGYDNIEKKNPTNYTMKYLKPGKISRKESIILKKQDLSMATQMGGNKRRVLNKLEDEKGMSSGDLPKYCYFRSQYGNRGCYFVIDGHPSLNGKIWQSTSSKKTSTKDKFKQMVAIYKNL
jgi:hypothetical protein